jgi:GH18 family chitinase
MKITRIGLYSFVFLLSLQLPLKAQPCREVMGYFAGWKWYDRGKMVNPLTIDYSKYTVLAYAFFKPSSDGSITCPDPWAEKNLLSGTAGGSKPAATLISEAHRHGVKVLISIGGWTYSDVFPTLAANPAARRKFAASCAQLVTKYGIEGIDIDWEYPGYEKHNGSKSDTHNFTLLLQDVRQALDRAGREQGKQILLTAAFGVSPIRLDAIEWDAVAGLLDMVNLMSYNYSGPWDEFTGHNAPLFGNGPENSTLNIDYTVNYLTLTKGVAASRINIGIAFYGRASTTEGKAILKGAATGKPDLVNFAADQGAPEYYNIMAQLPKYDYRYDKRAGVPYLEGKNGNNSFVTFDDSASVAMKATYALNEGLRGVIIWEISGDYVVTGPGKKMRTPLASAISAAFCTSLSDRIASDQGKKSGKYPEVPLRRPDIDDL